MYTLRSLALKNGKNTMVELALEFDGHRAFVIWDSIGCGNYRVKALLEIDPARLIRMGECERDYEYCGEIELPRPENN
jgi:hypothetical protein